MVAVYAKRPEVMHVYPPWKIWKGLHDRCLAYESSYSDFLVCFFFGGPKTIKEKAGGKGLFFQRLFLGDFPM